MEHLGSWLHSPLCIDLHSEVRLGFPSPAADYVQRSIDLTELLITRPAATYLVRASGDSMRNVGIFDGSILIVDRSREYRHNSIVIAAINGELTCKILDLRNQQLVPANNEMKPIPIPDDTDLVLEGTVIHVIQENVKGNL